MLEKSFFLWRLALEKDYFSTQLKLIAKTSHLYLVLLLSECRGCKHKLKSQNSINNLGSQTTYSLGDRGKPHLYLLGSVWKTESSDRRKHLKPQINCSIHLKVMGQNLVFLLRQNSH